MLPALAPPASVREVHRLVVGGGECRQSGQVPQISIFQEPITTTNAVLSVQHHTLSILSAASASAQSEQSQCRSTLRPASVQHHTFAVLQQAMQHCHGVTATPLHGPRVMTIALLQFEPLDL